MGSIMGFYNDAVMFFKCKVSRAEALTEEFINVELILL